MLKRNLVIYFTYYTWQVIITYFVTLCLEF